MRRSFFAGVLWLLASSGCVTAPRTAQPQVVEPCTDTLTCQRLAAERALEFGGAVAAEPASVRLAVEYVTSSVFVDRQAGLLYALVPTLEALELNAPNAAAEAFLDAFDRAGQPYVYWRSSWSYRGGAAPDEQAKQRAREAQGCGVLKVDPMSCVAVKVAAKDFMWKPTESCSFDSAGLDLPAAAASRPPATSRAEPVLSVRAEEAPRDQCTLITKYTLEARSAAGALRWSHPLGARQSALCAPP